ncbi:MAG: hypothetical protein ACOC0N_01195 [Chroococcales cyanobacterium]
MREIQSDRSIIGVEQLLKETQASMKLSFLPLTDGKDFLELRK